ncbi:MAG: O-antigen ligase family protein [Desulfobacterium sp.]|nr:O-antigen ligase family protein [Desulfobacterium sp.]
MKLAENGIPLLLVSLVALNQFPHTTAIINMVSAFTVIAVARALYKKSIPFSYETPLLIPLALFFAWSFIGLFFAINTWDSCRDFFSHFVRYVLFYFVIINVMDSRQKIHCILWTLILSTTLFSLWAMVNFYLIQGYSLSVRLGTSFPEFTTNIAGFASVMAIVFSMAMMKFEDRAWKKIVLIAAIIVLLAVSVLSQSRGTLLALIVSFLVLFATYKRVMIFTACALITTVAFVPLPKRTGEALFQLIARTNITAFSIEVAKDYPVWGTGFDINVFHYMQTEMSDKFQAYKSRVPAEYVDERFAQNTDWPRWPHSFVLSLLVRTGITGLLLFTGILGTVFTISINLVIKGKDFFIKEMGLACLACMVVFVTKALFEPVFVHFVDTLFYLLLAMITILWRMGLPRFNDNGKEGRL